MRKTLLASAATALMLAAGVASAAEITDTVEVVFTSEASCAFHLNDHTLEGSAYGANNEDGDGIAIGYSAQVQSAFQVACSNSVPYTVETDVGAGGFFTLTGDTTGEDITGFIGLGDSNNYSSALPLGALVNSEQYAGVGNGERQDADYFVLMNVGMDRYPLRLATPDVYRGNIGFTVSY